MDGKLLASLLAKDCVFGSAILSLEVTESTMEYTEGLVKSGVAQHGHVIMADFQSKGRGNVKGRVWDSRKGENLIVTVLLKRENLNITLQRDLSMAICQALRSCGVNAAIKWPNDTLVAGQKISGVMVRHEGEFYSIGFSVNVNEEMAEHEDRCSVIDVMDIRWPREMLLADILNRFSQFVFHAEEETKRKEYLNLSCTGPGANVRVFPNHKEDVDNYYVATVCDFTSEGLLIVSRGDNGETLTLATAEVSLRLQDISKGFADPKLPNADVITSLKGLWRHDLGSLLHLTPEENGNLEGWYSSAVGSVPSGKKFPLKGFWSRTRDQGALLGWTIAWEQPYAPKSLTTFSGRFYRDSGVLDTEWVLVTEKPPCDAWKSFLTNKNRYVKVVDECSR